MRTTRFLISPGNYIHRPDGSYCVVSVKDDFTEVVLKRHSDGGRLIELMHVVNANVDSGAWDVYDEDGVCLTRPDYRNSAVELDDEELAMYDWRRSFVKAAEKLPPYGPENPIFIRVVDETYKRNIEEHAKDKNKAIRNIWCQSPRPWTVYGWKLLASGPKGHAILAPQPKASTPASTHVDRDVEAIMTQVLDEIVASCKKAIEDRRTKKDVAADVPTTRAAYRRVAAEVDKANEKRSKESKPALKAPAFETFRRRYNRLDRKLLDEARYGTHVAKKRHGPFGKSYQIERILDRVEIDFFVGDVLVVIDLFGLLIPLGRPVHAVALDCNSRACLGMVIEFGEPDADTVLSLVRQILKPKSHIWQCYPHIQNRRDIFGCPALICWDNAWVFESHDLVASLQELLIARDPAGIRTPWHKPFIESWGGTFAFNFARLLPGHYKSIGESRATEWDPRNTAQIEFTDYVGRVWKWLSDFYHAKPHSGIGNIPPADYWFHGLHRLAGEGADSLFAPSGLEVDFKVARRFSLRCTEQGITLDKRRYDCPELNKLFTTAERTMRYDVRQDVNDVNRILVGDPRLQRPLVVPSAIQYPAGLTPKAFREMERAREALGVVNNILISETERGLSAGSAVRTKSKVDMTPQMQLALRLLSNPDAAALLTRAMTSRQSGPAASPKADLDELARAVWGVDKPSEG